MYSCKLSNVWIVFAARRRIARVSSDFGAVTLAHELPLR